MRKYLLLTIFFAAIFILPCSAQRTQLKGPTAKNYKPWKNSIQDQAEDHQSTIQLKGPKIKNQKPPKATLKVLPKIPFQKRIIKGPKAKNKYLHEFRKRKYVV